MGNEWILCTIIKIQNGGIAVTGMPNPKDRNNGVGVTPDAIFIQMGVALTGMPGSPQAGVIKVQAAPNISLVESALKM